MAVARLKEAIVQTKAYGLLGHNILDSGNGMTAEEAGRLFQDSVRIKNEKTRNILGSGLGLSVVKKLAQLYDGSVSVTSTPGQGSTFTVVLKKDAPAAPQTTP